MKIQGTIVRGKQLGRTIGFPTANLQPDCPECVAAPNGVYVARIAVEGYPEPLPCMLNQGTHPTAPEGAPTIEANIFDFGDDIYDRRAEIEYLRFLRPERRFPSLQALKCQLEADRNAAKEYFKNKSERGIDGA